MKKNHNSWIISFISPVRTPIYFFIFFLLLDVFVSHYAFLKKLSTLLDKQ